MGVFEAEGDVAAEAGDELIEGREAAIFDLIEAFDEGFEGLRADGGDDLGLVFEVEIDGGGGVFDAVGDAAHGDGVESVLDKQVDGCLQDFLAELVLFASSAFGNTHGTSIPSLPRFGHRCQFWAGWKPAQTRTGRVGYLRRL